MQTFHLTRSDNVLLMRIDYNRRPNSAKKVSNEIWTEKKQLDMSVQVSGLFLLLGAFGVVGTRFVRGSSFIDL